MHKICEALFEVIRMHPFIEITLGALIGHGFAHCLGYQDDPFVIFRFMVMSMLLVWALR